MTTTFTVERKDLHRAHWLESTAQPLADGQVRMRIERFALTSNNVTYGAFGDAMHYWDFFPSGDPATGCIPVWGFATVSESRVSEVAIGTRFYGYLPMADEIVLGPIRPTADGFVDAAAHRAALAGVYNHYLRCSTDPLYRVEHEGLIALLRPLFVTSFLIDDFLADNAFFGAGTVLLSSASSKTAYGLAFCLAARGESAPALKTIGLTSRRNEAFTRSLGVYDTTLAYADVDGVATEGGAVYVDMSGDAALRATVHRHWNERLAYSCSVGGTHWQALGGGKGLPGPRPVLFFAPAQAKKRAADWGARGLQERLATAWALFLQRVTDPSRPWLQVVSGAGRAAVSSTYEDLIEGRVPANEGRILAL